MNTTRRGNVASLPILDPNSWSKYMLAGSVQLPPHTAPENPTVGQGIITAYVTITERPPIDEYGVLIGDCLHNLRSALDTLAYSLSVSGPGPLTDDLLQASEFPIFGDVDRKGRSGSGPRLFQSNIKKIAGWAPDAQKVVEGLQPYARGNEYRRDPLWALHELDRVNKHRFLHTTVAHAGGTTINPLHTRNLRAFGPGIFEVFGGPVDADTLITRVSGIHPIDPDADVDMNIDVALEVAFAVETPGVGNQPVLETLATIYNYIMTSVVPPLTPYL